MTNNRNGTFVPTGDGFSVILTESGQEVAHIDVKDEQEAQSVLRQWHEGTYRILHG